jgi:hypothetical protein
MSQSLTSSLTLLFALLSTGLCIYLVFELGKLKEAFEVAPKKNEEGMKMKLQALERLTLFTERCRLSTLVTRSDSSQISTADFYQSLVESIKTEYDYNLSQQVYVSPEIWNAITKLKDQNIYIIHQITANLPPQATATDLAKLIIEYCQTPNADLAVVVLDALQFETQKVLS